MPLEETEERSYCGTRSLLGRERRVDAESFIGEDGVQGLEERRCGEL